MAYPNPSLGPAFTYSVDIPQCPICGKRYNTWIGMRNHMTFCLKREAEPSPPTIAPMPGMLLAGQPWTLTPQSYHNIQPAPGLYLQNRTYNNVLPGQSLIAPSIHGGEIYGNRRAFPDTEYQHNHYSPPKRVKQETDDDCHNGQSYQSLDRQRTNERISHPEAYSRSAVPATTSASLNQKIRSVDDQRKATDIPRTTTGNGNSKASADQTAKSSSNVRFYECYMCSMKYKSPWDLEMHIMSHVKNTIPPTTTTQSNNSTSSTTTSTTANKASDDCLAMGGSIIPHIKKEPGTETNAAPDDAQFMRNAYPVGVKAEPEDAHTDQPATSPSKQNEKTSSVEYECCLCQHTVHSLAELTSHLVSHTQPVPCMCCECGKWFTTPKFLSQHIKKAHSDSEKTSCNTTSANQTNQATRPHATESGSVPREGSSTGSSEQPAMCMLCGKHFENMSALFTHSFTHSRQTAQASTPLIHATKNTARPTTADAPIDLTKKASPLDLTNSAPLIQKTECQERDIKPEINNHVPNESEPSTSAGDDSGTPLVDVKTEDGLHICILCGVEFDTWDEVNAHLEQHNNPPSSTNPDNTNQQHTNFSVANLGMKKKNAYSKRAPPGTVRVLTKDFGCPFCGRYFLLRTDLERHIVKHTGERPWKCLICSVRFGNPSTLYKHIVSHTKTNPNTCLRCHSVFQHTDSLVAHILTHVWDNNTPTCPYCGKERGTIKALKSHILMHLQVIQFECQYCGQGFIRKPALIKHVRHHTGVELPHCPICNKEFSAVGALQRHRRKVFNKCFTAGSVFENADGIIPQPAVVKQEPVQNITQTGDMKKTNKTPVQKIQRVQKVQSRTCKQCGVTVPSLGEFREHVKQHREEFQKRKQELKELKEQTKETRIHQLKEQHTDRRYRKCLFCEKTFRRASKLKKHMASHQCSCCGIMFKRQSELLKHKAAITKERRFITCPVCPDKFSHVSVLNRHIKTHEMHQCTTCDNEYLSEKALCKHLCDKTLNVCDFSTCGRCVRGFELPGTLCSHLRRHQETVLKARIEVAGKE